MMMRHPMSSNPAITIFGAYGHTGRFVVAEVRRRGWTPILSGRDPEKLRDLAGAHPGLELRPATIGDRDSLDRALAGAAAVINCAGPFAQTAGPVIEAALGAHIPYLDIAAEVEANADTFAQYEQRARDAGIVVLPAMAFYGGLGDLLATAALADWPAADAISIAYALSSWKPTLGTRATIQTSKQRRAGCRLVYANGKMELRTDDAPLTSWTFPEPLGEQPVVGEFTTADSVTIPRHLQTPEIRTYMTVAPLRDLSDPDLSGPPPVDESGKSAQTFLLEVVLRRGRIERRAIARGQDIYAVTAPLVVEAATRLVRRPPEKGGTFAAGEIFPAEEFLRSLTPAHFTLTINQCSKP
jgi:hypothetical protein